MPAVTPVTVPPDTVATPGLPLVQVPPVGVEAKVVVPGRQMVCVPVRAVGCVLTVTPYVAGVHPLVV